MDIKEYFLSMLKFKSKGNGLDNTAKIVIKEKKIKQSKKSSTPSVSSAKTEHPSGKKKDTAPKNNNSQKEGKNKSTIKSIKDHVLDHIVEVGNQYNSKVVASNYDKYVPTINKDELSKLNSSDGMLITIGLDFGTHQTKVCIECKGGVELSYTFLKYKGSDNKMYYTLPSIIGIDSNNKLHYGYLPKKFNGKIIRYFKQTVFRGSSHNDSGQDSMSQDTAFYYSTWYIAYILFELEDVFGPNFTIQMGAPTDSIHINQAKQIATRIIASAYKLVEDVFVNDKKRFLNTDYNTLKEITEIVSYTRDLKDSYGLLVFPEAYACLKPLTAQRKIKNGYMNLMIDIGGGTTDISFFTTQQNKPQLYDFFSINKGLNYLTLSDDKSPAQLDSNIKNENEIDSERLNAFIQKIKDICYRIEQNVIREFKIKYPSLYIKTVYTGFKNRPLVYSGGGSTFASLRLEYGGFIDIKQISESEWNTKVVTQIKEIKSNKLFSILSTAYGLAISTENDDIPMTSYDDFFKEVVPYSESDRRDFNYTDDYSAIK